MPLIRANVQGDVATLDADLGGTLSAIPAGAPVIVLIHGYKFSPSGPTTPHEHILSLSPTSRCRKAISWPRHLGFGKSDPDEGLCIALGWEARGTIWSARRAAIGAGQALAGLIDQIDRPVHIVAHSLGTRVALSALSEIRAGRIGRMVLLAAAEMQDAAQAALGAPGARGIDVLNVTSRENDLFDAAYETLVRPGSSVRTLGAGLPRPDPRWLDVQIDCPTTLDLLRDMGFVIGASDRRICHWSAYLRPGLFKFYSAFLREPARLPLALLACHLPDQTERRWSRLIPRARRIPPLPILRKPSF